MALRSSERAVFSKGDPLVWELCVDYPLPNRFDPLVHVDEVYIYKLRVYCDVRVVVGAERILVPQELP